MGKSKASPFQKYVLRHVCEALGTKKPTTTRYYEEGYKKYKSLVHVLRLRFNNELVPSCPFVAWSFKMEVLAPSIQYTVAKPMVYVEADASEPIKDIQDACDLPRQLTLQQRLEEVVRYFDLSVRVVVETRIHTFDKGNFRFARVYVHCCKEFGQDEPDKYTADQRDTLTDMIEQEVPFGILTDYMKEKEIIT